MPDPIDLGDSPVYTPPTPAQKSEILNGVGINSSVHDADADGGEISVPAGDFFNTEGHTIIVINGDVNAPSLGAGFVLPPDATDPLPFSTTAGLYDILKIMWIEHANHWAVVSFIPGYAE